MQINTDSVILQTLEMGARENIEVDLLRADLVHPIISGNKWFKLRFYLEEALQQGATEVASFGGAYSNHIVATACACKQASLKSIGFIRGDQTEELSHTLQMARSFGMELVFVNRTDYRDKAGLMQQNQQIGRYWISEGGYGPLGAKGAATMLDTVALEKYHYLVAAVGSGTMIAGILNGSLPQQRVLGISSQKNNHSLRSEILLLTDAQQQHRLDMVEDYHFGGFAKHPATLLAFMNQFWQREKVPTDMVYTGKLFYALEDLIQKKYFQPYTKILAIHSGGLQGNLSLPENSLSF